MIDAGYLSGYRLMWIFVMFDLPVGTKKESREATKFREFLLDEGFEMSQFEPPRVCRRLQLLKRWSLYEQDDEQICA